MKKIIINTIIVLVFAGLFATGCNKEEARPAPLISFITGSNYTSSDATVFAGDSVLIGIHGEWNGTDEMKTLSISANNTVLATYQLSGQDAESFNYGFTITKTDIASELWLFEATDAQGVKNSVSLNLTTDNSGAIPVNIVATIGAQDNTTDFGYYSVILHTNYNAADAQENSDKIDFLGAYDATNETHLVSPDANNLPEPYLSEMSDWTSRNATLFCATTWSPDQFDYINRDYLLVSSFSTNPDNQKNKAKNLKVDDVYSFKTGGGKYGLFKVTSVTTGTSGKVSIEIKVQP